VLLKPSWFKNKISKIKQKRPDYYYKERNKKMYYAVYDIDNSSPSPLEVNDVRGNEIHRLSDAQKRLIKSTIEDKFCADGVNAHVLNASDKRVIREINRQGEGNMLSFTFDKVKESLIGVSEHS
jgi:hypothetical protein